MIIAENFMNDIAVVLEKEPSDVRYPNLFKDGQTTHYNQTVEGYGWRDVKQTTAILQRDRKNREQKHFNLNNWFYSY